MNEILPNLTELGWNSLLEAEFRPYAEQGYQPARVASQNKNAYLLYVEKGTVMATLAGRFRHEACSKSELPAVGDWVVIHQGGPSEAATIRAVLTRKSYFARKPAISGGRKLKNGVIDGGATEEQIIAANIDTAFIVTSMDGNFSQGRLERYLTLAYSSGARPVIILSKADLCPDPGAYIAEAESVAIGVAVHTVSAVQSLHMDLFDPYLQTGQTVVFLGSSGVGKSTMINRILGYGRQKTGTVSADTGKGRHTTTAAELIRHPSGCMVVDTAGMRELQLWCDSEALEVSFEEIADLTLHCRYSDCQHDGEPGCAVMQAVRDGTVSEERVERYKKLHTEVGRLRARRRQWESHLTRQRKARGLGRAPD